MMQIWKRAGAAALAAVMVLALPAAALAAAKAETTEYTIDPEKTVSVTIYKYDNYPGSQEEADGTLLADTKGLGNPIEDVTFAYKKVADIKSVRTTAAQGEDRVELRYDLDASLASILGIESESPYTAEALQTALAGKLTESSEAETKRALETYISGSDEITTDEDGMASTGEIAASGQGLYLFVETRHPGTCG